MKIPFLDLTQTNHSQSAELSHIFEETIHQDLLLGGKAVIDFEKAFANYLSIGYCIGCSNGTDALEIILRALEIGEGDEVIVPANGWLSAAEMVKLIKATPVFVDIEHDSYNIDPKLIEGKISNSTKAIIPIHLYGQPANMPAIMEVSKKHRLFVIEDCAQAHGATIHGKKVGAWGNAAAFSFYPTKNLGALGDAGAILTDDSGLARKCRMIANHGQLQRDDHRMLGRNSRMDTIQAAVLKFRLELLDKNNQKRQKLAALYRTALSGLPIILPDEKDSYHHVYHLFVIRTPQRDALKNYLSKEGIGTVIHYPHAVSDIKYLNPTHAPIASLHCGEVLSLPLYPELAEGVALQVCEKIRSFFQESRL